MPATPDLLWLGQSLPAASAPAPGPHTSLCWPDLSSRQGVGLIRIAPGPFQTQVDQSFQRTESAATTDPFQPHGCLDIRMSLSTLFSFADIARRRSKVRPQPLCHSGWHRAPWAPSSCPRLSRPSVLSVAGRPFVSSGVVRFSAALAASRLIAFVLTESPALM